MMLLLLLLHSVRHTEGTADGSWQLNMESLLLSWTSSQPRLRIMTWRAPPNDSAGFGGIIRRELPAFILVLLHISIGVHAKGEADPFLQISPSSARSSVCISRSLRFYTQGEGWHSLAEIVGFS